MFFLGYHSHKAAVICKEKNLIRFEYFRTFNQNVQPLYILKSLLQKKKFETITGLETKEVLLRFLSLKLKSKKEIIKALPFQIETLLPYTQDELILIPTLYPHESITEVQLLASSNKSLTQHIKNLEVKGIDPDIVSCVPTALFRFSSHFFPEYPSLFIHYNESHSHTFLVMHENRLKAFQSHKPQDLERMCAFMKNKYPEIQHIFSTDQENFPKDFTPLKLKDPKFAEYAIPIGLALDAIKKNPQSCQFRPRTFPSEKKQKRQKKYLLNFLFLTVFFIMMVHLMGHFHLKKQENAILDALGYPKTFRLHKVVQELEESINQEKKSAIQPFALPKIHEILLWLSSHPNLNEKCSIHLLQYQVEKSPKLNTPVQNMRAKLELEMYIPHASMARSFYETLLKETTWIDQSKPIQWSADHGIYRTTFYIKPKILK